MSGCKNIAAVKPFTMGVLKKNNLNGHFIKHLVNEMGYLVAFWALQPGLFRFSENRMKSAYEPDLARVWEKHHGIGRPRNLCYCYGQGNVVPVQH